MPNSVGLIWTGFYQPTGSLNVDIFPHSILDSFVYGNGDKSLAEMAIPIVSFGERINLFQGYKYALFSNKTVKDSATLLYHTMNTERLHFKAAFGLQLPAHSIPGQIISPNHFDMTLKNGTELIMCPQGDLGTTLNGILDAKGMKSVFGPITLKLIEAIGFSTRSNPQMIALRIFN